MGSSRRQQKLDSDPLILGQIQITLIRKSRGKWVCLEFIDWTTRIAVLRHISCLSMAPVGQRAAILLPLISPFENFYNHPSLTFRCFAASQPGAMDFRQEINWKSSKHNLTQVLSRHENFTIKSALILADFFGESMENECV